MRKALEESLDATAMRAQLSQKQIKELSMLLSSTHGPVVIAAFIEHGLEIYRDLKKKKKKGERE